MSEERSRGAPRGKGPAGSDGGSFDSEVPWSGDSEKLIEEAIGLLMRHKKIKTILIAIAGEDGASKVEVLTGEKSDLKAVYEAVRKALGVDDPEETIN